MHIIYLLIFRRFSMNLNRNDECWCRSGKKYKKCHLEFDEKLNNLKAQGFEVPTRDLIKNEEKIQGIRESAKINNGVLDLVSEKIKLGMSTEEINTLVYEYTVNHGAIPAPLNYGGFPKSVCTSINDVVCHGIPSEDEILQDGDIVNVDVSTILNGYYSDASRMFMIGNVSTEDEKLVRVCKECLDKGFEAIKPWGTLGDIGAAVQEHAEANGFSVVRAFGGHGVGLKFHEDPFVAHVGKRGEGMVLAPGMVFTIEPMLNQGDYEVFVDEDDEWTTFTEDGGYSAQWEYTVLVTETGAEIIAR
jgi:methionyl aminopeptidase